MTVISVCALELPQALLTDLTSDDATRYRVVSAVGGAYRSIASFGRACKRR